ncbi:acyl-CoA thioesterase [Halomonas sp. LBP4]|uniref:acyl-CoA thioesterase n=1 Tax=Halomonas sp. LBP4 TaxID=2044917 RepID=UPI000D76E791|nr:hotdog domain-containing protein [Halomonas sp. LBP4]PXX99355.1 acyl-CoA thioesterase [Halomonas sp. LBP4]
MKYRTRKMVAAKDLNSNGQLFGGRVLSWIDEEAFIFVVCQLDTASVVTASISEVYFVASARRGDLVEIGTEVVEIGRSSITVRCEVRNRETQQTITKVERIVFVHVDENCKPVPHGIAKPCRLEAG